MKAIIRQLGFLGITALYLTIMAGCAEKGPDAAGDKTMAGNMAIDFVVGPQLTRPQLEGVFTEFMGILEQLKSGSVSLIDPAFPRRIATFSLPPDQTDLSWNQRQYEWRNEIKAAREHLMKLAEAPDSRGFDAMEALGYIARTSSEPGLPREVVLAGAPRLDAGKAWAEAASGRLRTHVALISPEVKRDAACGKLSSLIHDSRTGMLASCETDLRDVVANIWKPANEGPWIDVADQPEMQPHAPLPSFSRTKIVLTWQNPGSREQTDLDLAVSDGTEIVDFKHPSGRFGEWSRSTVATLNEPSWEKIYIKDEINSPLKIIVSHTNGQPPRNVRLEWFNDVTGERLGGKILDGFTTVAAWGSRPAMVKELDINELVEKIDPVAGQGTVAVPLIPARL